jgi:hypothetical protein
MGIGRYRDWIVLGAAVWAAGCAGNGQGLDQNGQPLGSEGAGTPLTADFQSIQDNVFTPICSKCHIGAGAPEGLQLDAAHSYNLLVGVPSAEAPTLVRVKPGDPDSSYVVQKIEGAAGIVGGQMPLGETPLPQATIDAIRQWITDGAPNVPSAGASSFAVDTTAPLDHAVVKAPPTHIVVTFTQEVDASLINDSTVTLMRMAEPLPDAQSSTAARTSAMTDGMGQRIPVTGALAEHNPSVLLINPIAPLASGTYRVTVRGTGGGAVANLRATTLGSDRSFVFTVESGQ